MVEIYLFAPGKYGFYPKCPTKTLLGLDCAFCGGLRAVHMIMHGDLSGSMEMNPGVMLLPVILVIAAIATFHERLRSKVLSINALYIGIALFIILSVLRNI